MEALQYCDALNRHAGNELRVELRRVGVVHVKQAGPKKIHHLQAPRAR